MNTYEGIRLTKACENTEKTVIFCRGNPSYSFELDKHIQPQLSDLFLSCSHLQSFLTETVISSTTSQLIKSVGSSQLGQAIRSSQLGHDIRLQQIQLHLTNSLGSLLLGLCLSTIISARQTSILCAIVTSEGNPKTRKATYHHTRPERPETHQPWTRTFLEYISSFPIVGSIS